MIEVTMPGEDEVSIYVLTEPDGITVRYVGKAQVPQSRYLSHIAETKAEWASGKRMRWFAALLAQGKRPRMFVIEVTTKAGAAAAEGRWIYHYNTEGRKTLNSSCSRLGPHVKLTHAEEAAPAP